MDKYVGSSEKVSQHESVVSIPHLVISSLDCINAESS